MPAVLCLTSVTIEWSDKGVSIILDPLIRGIVVGRVKMWSILAKELRGAEK